ncbi:selenium-dependent molybdenum cofactor biosynthesis protein YqeB [Desulfovibrio aminophilus]|uniref:selenium-dependent molybdenum cofactor biosynthesis protein YqeB n=1 Tax=Desulfovibrio aminophilus TaxID=81425 RepID=UPI00339524FA
MIHALHIVIRGAGDLATGVALRLWRSGFRRLVLLEREMPLSVRRLVCFSEAVREGVWRVEDVTAQRAPDIPGVNTVLAQGRLPVLVDPSASFVPKAHPDVLIDATIAKRNLLGTSMDQAELVIALGPGFTAGVDCHRVVETHRGHGMGRVIASGSALPNTGIPGAIMGYTKERVLRAPCDGIFETSRSIGQTVAQGEQVGIVNGMPVLAGIPGVLRGLLPHLTPVSSGLKLGDVDPRGDASHCTIVSDKALAVGGGVLEAIMEHFNTGPDPHNGEAARLWPLPLQ